jgi:hypothetical protein
MKKRLLLMTVAFAVLAITGCQKEKNKLDKRLTADTWKLGNYSYNMSQVSQTDFTSTSLDDTKTTETNTKTFSGSTLTEVSYNENVGGTTTVFTRQTETSSYSAEVKFNEEGTFELKITKALKTSKSEAGGFIDEENFSVDPTVQTITGYWVWGNNTGAKEVIVLDGLGQYTVELSKDELILTNVTSNNETKPTLDGSLIRVGTTTSSENTEEIWTWTK